MKRKIWIGLFLFTLCFAFTGCGVNKSDKSKDTNKSEMITIVGTWTCEKIEVVDNGEKLDQKTIKAMFGDDYSNVLKLTAYSDGTANINLMSEESTFFWKESKKNQYKFSTSASNSDNTDELSAKLEDDQLIMIIKETYSSNGKKQDMEMQFTMKYIGKKSTLVKGWDVTFDDEDVYSMSNAMSDGECIEVDGMLYGNFGGKDWGQGAFMCATINDNNLDDKTIIKKNVKVTNLTYYDGSIYGIFDNKKIIKLEAGETEVEVVYEGTCNYLQVTDKGIYFTDENEEYCQIDFNGKNKKTILKKKVFYPYQVSSKFLVYQDDGDGETLHIYNMKNGDDTKISDMVSYKPMLCGDYLYFYTPGSNEEMNYLCRINMYSGKQEKAEHEALMFDYYVTPDHISVAVGGFVTIEFNEWDKIHEKSSAGFPFYPIYSNGEIWVTRSYGENFMGPKKFGTDDEKSIGYTFER